MEVLRSAHTAKLRIGGVCRFTKSPNRAKLLAELAQTCNSSGSSRKPRRSGGVTTTCVRSAGHVWALKTYRPSTAACITISSKPSTPTGAQHAGPSYLRLDRGLVNPSRHSALPDAPSSRALRERPSRRPRPFKDVACSPSLSEIGRSRCPQSRSSLVSSACGMKTSDIDAYGIVSQPPTTNPSGGPEKASGYLSPVEARSSHPPHTVCQVAFVNTSNLSAHRIKPTEPTGLRCSRLAVWTRVSWHN